MPATRFIIIRSKSEINSEVFITNLPVYHNDALTSFSRSLQGIPGHQPVCEGEVLLDPLFGGTWKATRTCSVSALYFDHFWHSEATYLTLMIVDLRLLKKNYRFLRNVSEEVPRDDFIKRIIGSRSFLLQVMERDNNTFVVEYTMICLRPQECKTLLFPEGEMYF